MPSEQTAITCSRKIISARVSVYVRPCSLTDGRAAGRFLVQKSFTNRLYGFRFRFKKGKNLDCEKIKSLSNIHGGNLNW